MKSWRQLGVKMIIKTLKSTSSGKGMTFYNIAGLCAHKANLLEEKTEEDTYACCRFQSEQGKVCGKHVGVALHLMLEHYHKSGVTEFDFQLDEMGLEDVINEAFRVFVNYTGHYSPNAFGRVEAAELHIPNDCPKETPTQILAMFAVELTGRLDMVVELTDSEAADLSQAANINLPGAGYYIIDHKSKGKNDKELVNEYMYSDQFVAYPAIWTAAFPHKPCRGTIVNTIIRHKKMSADSFFLTYVPPPSIGDISALSMHLIRTEEALRRDVRNRSACIGRYGVCGYRLSGVCHG